MALVLAVFVTDSEFYMYGAVDSDITINPETPDKLSVGVQGRFIMTA